MLWAARQGVWVRGRRLLIVQRGLWGCQQKEGRQCLYKLQDTGSTSNPPCPPPTEKGGANPFTRINSLNPRNNPVH